MPNTRCTEAARRHGGGGGGVTWPVLTDRKKSKEDLHIFLCFFFLLILFFSRPRLPEKGTLGGGGAYISEYEAVCVCVCMYIYIYHFSSSHSIGWAKFCVGTLHSCRRVISQLEQLLSSRTITNHDQTKWWKAKLSMGECVCVCVFLQWSWDIQCVSIYVCIINIYNVCIYNIYNIRILM